MATVSKPLPECARDVFAGLGYTVTGEADGRFRATRDWKEVRVVTVGDAEETPDCSGSLRCFVTWADRADRVARSLREREGSGAWALVGVTPDGDYEVVRYPSVAV